MRILGVSAFYHDAAAALVVDGRIVAAAQEERFTRKKHDARFPKHAIAYCLRHAGLALSELDYIAFYDKPLLKFERLMETYLSFASRGRRSFVAAMPVWLKEKLFLDKLLRDELGRLAEETGCKAWSKPLRMAAHVRKQTGMRNLCMAGGVALNCVANGQLLRERVFDRLWIQPAAGDAGGAVGAALAVHHVYLGLPRRVPVGRFDGMHGAYLGPAYPQEEIEAFLTTSGYPFERLVDKDLFETVAELLAQEAVVGWFQDRMEFGPRALGNRSILGDARSPRMQSLMNLKIKYRESFRPFAPAVLEERVADYFELDEPSPYMLLVAPVRTARRVPSTEEDRRVFGIQRLSRPRSDIPAVTHLDYSARIQTVSRETNPRFYSLLKAFEAKTGYGVLVNTSFNVRGEPIVCTPADAYRCFMRTEMDALVLGNCLLRREAQPPPTADTDWRKEFQLD